MTDLQDARQKLRDALGSLDATEPELAQVALTAAIWAKRRFDLAELGEDLPTRADVDEMARAGDWDGVKRAFRAQAEHAIAQFEAELQEEAGQRRNSADPRERASQACRDGDPNWRSIMPLRWHISRWWWIWSTPIAMTAAIIGGAVALFWWLT